MTGKIVKKKDFEGTLGLEDQVIRDESITVGMAPAGSRRVISKEVYEATSEAQCIVDGARAEVQKVRREAESVLKRVNEEMERAKKKGFEEGREEGLAQVSEMLVSAPQAKKKMFQGIEREVIKLEHFFFCMGGRNEH